jgi:GTP cyclohydrolase II
MSLSPRIEDRIAALRAGLRAGLPLILRDQARASLVIAAETAPPGTLAEWRTEGLAPVLAITDRRAETLRARAYDGDIARIAVPPSADARWIASVINPADDLDTPMKGPFQTLRDGFAAPHRAAITLCKQALLMPAALVAELPDELAATLAGAGVGALGLAELAAFHSRPPQLREVAAARVPLALAPEARVRVFRPDDGLEEHYAIEIGSPDRSMAVLCRLHSACFTGDLLGSLKCDCGAQLQGALSRIAAEGSGVLLYLNQEGRGIGLANKLRAYRLQEQGFDTVEANHRIGFEDDERDFRIGAAMLRAMNYGAVRLLTNNPAKFERLRACGIIVAERVPLHVGQTAQNAGYLATKARKSGHLL